jgi:hypothetical protein
MAALGLAGALLAGCSSCGPKAAAEAAVKPVYCYETLALVDCYRTPQAGWENRLVGFYGPAPMGFAD